MEKTIEQLAEEYADNTIGFSNENNHLLEPCKLDFIAGHTAASEGMVSKSQFDNQMKHKESLKQYWLSCSESKAKWVESIKEYFDGEHTEIKTFDEFKYQFDLD